MIYGKKLLSIVLLLASALAGCKKKSAGGPGAGGMPPASVVTARAVRQPVVETLSLVGTITANEMVEIQSEIDGTVVEIGFQEGQRVKQGDLLVRLDETKLAAALAEAEANFRLTRSTFDRSKQLFDEKLISQQEFDQAASTFKASDASLELKRRQLKDARIVAPFSGVVGARNVSPGQVITKATPLTWVVDYDPVKVEINVPERFISQLQVGQGIAISVATYGTRKFNGEVYFIAPQVDQTTRTALIKARLANSKFELKPGMFANLDLTLKTRENSIVIPELALGQLVEGDRATVFVVGSDAVVQPRTVKLGLRLAGHAEIEEGLKEGDEVVVEGLQKVAPGGRVRAAGGEKIKN